MNFQRRYIIEVRKLRNYTNKAISNSNSRKILNKYYSKTK